MENNFNFEHASYADLLAEAKRLNDLVSSLNNKNLYVQKAFANRDRQYAVTKQIVSNLIENGEISNEEYVAELIEILEIEILKEVNFTLTIEVTGTVEIPLGSELDEYSFDLDGLSYNGDNVSIDNESVSIDHWEFTE
jgi:hypothetical protein